MIPHVNCNCPGLGVYARHCPTHGEQGKQIPGTWDDIEGDIFHAPTPRGPCYDCGSDIPGHHTLYCEFAAPGDMLDLPARPGTQHWVGAGRVKVQP